MKLWHSYLKELKLSSKSFYFYVEILMTVIILIVLLVFIPENITSTETEYITLEMPDQYKTKYLESILEEDLDQTVEVVDLEYKDQTIQAELYALEGQDIYIISDRADLIELTKVDRPKASAVIIWNEEAMQLEYEYYIQGYESERLQNLYRIIHSEDLKVLEDKVEATELRVLDNSFEELNSREMALPSLLTFNGSLMGFFIVAAYIFLDKGEGVIKAYAVTASKVWVYLMSKCMVLMTTSVLTTVITVAVIMGTQPNYFMLVVLLLTSAFFASSMGLLVTSYYDSLTKSFGVLYTVMMVFMLPAIAYFIPSWNPFWIRLIPIHYLIQSFKEIIIVNGDMTYVALSALGFLVLGILLFLWSNHRYKKTLTV